MLAIPWQDARQAGTFYLANNSISISRLFTSGFSLTLSHMLSFIFDLYV